MKHDEVIEELKHFQVKAFPIFIHSNIKELFEINVIGPTMRDMDEFEERDSGWFLQRVEHLNVIICKYNPMRCASYIKLPTSIANKKACINVKNTDEECFR